MKNLNIEFNGCEYIVKNDTMSIFKSGEKLAAFKLSPEVEGTGALLLEWEEKAKEHYYTVLDTGGSVHLAIEHGHVCYWMEADDVDQFEKLTYFPGSTFNGNSWCTYVSDELDNVWDIDRQVMVPVSSAYNENDNNVDGSDGAGMADPGDKPPTWIFNVNVRALSFNTLKGGWVGLAVPGPLPVGVTRFTMDRRKFSMDFEVLRTNARDWGMPKVYFVTGLTHQDDLLDEYRIISDRLGLTVTRAANHPAWWMNPAYKYWDEYQRISKEKPELEKEGKVLTVENIYSWINFVKESVGLDEIDWCFEQGCYLLYGDYRPIASLGGVEGLRKTVDKMREAGTHTAYYIHPYIVNTKVEFYKKHPEAFCKKKKEASEFSFSLETGDDNPEYALIDWTNPVGRQFILDTVKFILSSEPGCLNCDILRSNNWESPDPREYDFHDPDWGIGDLMTMKAQKLMYEEAKRIKPDCLVSKSAFADPFMQPWADVNLLCEEWTAYTHNWYRRGRIVSRTIRDVIMRIDPWFVSLTKGNEYYMSGLAWTVPETFAVQHAIHPYIYYRKYGEKDLKRRCAGFRTYMNAPYNITDISHVDWNPSTQEADIWRKKTYGKLSGWYAAMAVSKRCFVTYSETEARIAASESRFAVIPLPPDSRIKSVEIVPHRGNAAVWDYRLIDQENGQAVEMFIEDCGIEAMYYRISYELPD